MRIPALTFRKAPGAVPFPTGRMVPACRGGSRERQHRALKNINVVRQRVHYYFEVSAQSSGMPAHDNKGRRLRDMRQISISGRMTRNVGSPATGPVLSTPDPKRPPSNPPGPDKPPVMPPDPDKPPAIPPGPDKPVVEPPDTGKPSKPADPPVMKPAGHADRLTAGQA